MTMISRTLFCVFIVATLVVCASARRKVRKSLILRQKETNAIDFIRIAVMRLIYGIATRVGLGEQISEALNGAFVPPGADEYGDYEGTIFNRDDDYDDY